jgi:TPR repeat protein
MKTQRIVFIVLLNLVYESVGKEEGETELRQNIKEVDDNPLEDRRGDEANSEIEDSVQHGELEGRELDGNEIAATSSESWEEGGQTETYDEYDHQAFDPGLSSQQSQLNVQQQPEDGGSEDQLFPGSVPVGLEEATEPTQPESTSVDSEDSYNVPTFETGGEEMKQQMKWTQQELEEGDRLCAEALKLVDSKTESEKAFDLFEKASKLGNGTALGKVAFAQLFGSYIPQNSSGAFEKFSALAEDGLPLGQMGLGFMYATGVGVNSSQAKALVYYQFAALGGDAYAQMIMGYRYWAGVTLLQSCESGLTYYRKVAGTVAEKVTPHGGPIIQRSRLVDETEPSSQTQEIDEDLLQYYAFLADKGDMQAAVALGQLYYQGGRGVEKDLQKAMHFFSLAAKEEQNPIAYAFLGMLYYEENLEVEQDYEKALNYFEKSAKEVHVDFVAVLLYMV